MSPEDRTIRKLLKQKRFSATQPKVRLFSLPEIMAKPLHTNAKSQSPVDARLSKTS